MSDRLETRIKEKQAHIGVMGLGYVGLPLVRVFHQAGFTVTGFDIDTAKVDALNDGRSYIKAFPDSMISNMVKSGRFRAYSDSDQLANMDAIIVCVPTPLTKMRQPDLSYIQITCEAIKKHLKKGQLIVLESTTYPGTTDEVVKPILEQSGLTAGKDFFLAFSPEREDPGNVNFNTRNIPKVVGGIDTRGGELAAALYAQAVDHVVPVSSARVAEATKILENVYRAVNIALVNELKVVFDHMDIDVWEVIAAASTKPFGFQPFYPGPGLGGHCIPIDPFYLTYKAHAFDISTRFIELAGEINKSMPDYVVDKITKALNKLRKTVNGSRGLVLGVAYKPGTDDMRESPAIQVMEKLQALGANLCFFDPYVKNIPQMRQHDVKAERVELTEQSLKNADYVLITTQHKDIDYSFVVKHSQLVIDTRNATQHVIGCREKIVKA